MATVIVSSACRSKVPSQSALRELRWCGEEVKRRVGGRSGEGGRASVGARKAFR